MKSSDQNQIGARRDEWVSIVNSRDLAAYALLVSKDVVWFPPGMAPIEGREAFKEWVRPFFERFEYEFSIEDATIRVSADWAVESGTFKTRLISETGAVTEHGGRYLVFWHRESDGVWYLERYQDQGPD